MRIDDFQLIECDFGERRLCSFFSAIASVASAAIQASAAEDAAELQAEAAENSLALQREQFEASRSDFEASRRDLAPFSQVGFGALNELSRIFLGTDSPLALQNAVTGRAPELFDPADLRAERASLVEQRNRAPAPSTVTGGRPGFDILEETGPDSNRVTVLPGPAPGPVAIPGALDDRIAEIDRLIAEGLASNRASSSAEEFGTFAPGQLSEDERLSNFFASPDFTFRRDEGEKAINRALAARGLSNSGAALRELTSFNSSLAAGEFTNFKNSLFRLAGLGADATGASVNLGQSFAGSSQNFANAAGQNLLDAGTARASGVAGRSNALTGGLNNLDFLSGGQNFFSGFGNTAGTGRAGGVGTVGVGGGFASTAPVTNASLGIF